MKPHSSRAQTSFVQFAVCIAAVLAVTGATRAQDAIKADLNGYNAANGIKIAQTGDKLEVGWTGDGGRSCGVVFSLKQGSALINSLNAGGPALALNVEPVFLVTTGARVQRPGVKYIFFDKPSTEKNGPVKHFTSKLDLKSAKVTSTGNRATISFGKFSAGPFSGELNFYFYAGSPFMQVEAAMSQPDKAVAYLYDAVLDGEFNSFAWQDVTNKWVRASPTGPTEPVAVKYRTIMAENGNGTVAIFPAPHAFFFPRDYSINFKFAQVGKGRFGLRQDPVGGRGHQGEYIPWFDAPENKPQRMSLFVLLSNERAEGAMEQVKRYTRGDMLKPLDGYITFASHMHSHLTVNENTDHPKAPDFKKVFKGMGVQAFQLAEFHGDGHPENPGTVRLDELKGMFELCRKYSDEDFLMIPSEEANAYFPGHSVLLFPRPVYLTLVPIQGAPFSEDIAGYGKIYHPQNLADLVRVVREENGLAWSSHPRIKASEKAPDVFKDTEWYKSAMWLGGTWKAMPADLSEPRMGVRSLDLLDDMNLWGQRKMIPGEVDCFDIDETHEIYAHMNVNYLHLAKLPGKEDWSPILDVLRRGDFFVTTGEVLIRSCVPADGKLRAELEWTLPLGQVELVTSDGKTVTRKTVPLPATKEFGRQTFEWPVDLKGVQWVRLEVWDVAYDGAFTQPIYLR